MDEYPEDWDQSDAEYDSEDDIALEFKEPDNDVIFDNDEEELEEDSRQRKNRISLPIMYEYEMSNVLEKRQQSIDKGSVSKMETEISRLGITSSYEIALLEFKSGKLPNYKLIRNFDKGIYEVWRHSDFLYFPKI